MDERLHPSLPKKGNYGITKNYTLTATAYNTLTWSQGKFRKNQNCFQRNWFIASQIQTHIEGVCAKNLKDTIICRFLQGIWFYTQGKDCAILQTIPVRWTRLAGHCWKSKGERINDILLWTTTHGHTSIGQQVKTYIHELRHWMQPIEPMRSNEW